MNITALNTPLGWMNLEAGDWALYSSYFTPHPHQERSDHPLLLEASRQLIAYFEGKLQTFELPIEPAGTVWQRQVWLAAARVGFGKTTSYSALSLQLGDGGVRSLASALSANPLAVIVPCHRVVGSAGQLAGYAWGTQRKAWLLNHEQSSLQGSLF